MKKIIVLTVSALLALSLVSCAATPSSPERVKVDDEKETASAGAESDGAEQTSDPLGDGRILPEIPIE